MVIDATKSRPKEFEIAEKAGVKGEMINAINDLVKEYNGVLPKSFGAEELYFMVDKGMQAAGVKVNFEVKSLMVLARAFLHGYSLGKHVKGE